MHLNTPETAKYITEALKNSYDLTVTSCAPFVGDHLTLHRSLNPGKVGFFGRLNFNPYAIWEESTPTYLNSGIIWTAFRGVKMDGVGINHMPPYGSSFASPPVPPVTVDFALFDQYGYIDYTAGGLSLHNAVLDIKSAGAPASGIIPNYPYLTFTGFKIQFNG